MNLNLKHDITYDTMHPIFLRTTSKRVTKPTDKAKAVIDEQLEISSKKERMTILRPMHRQRR
jgi:hypothetical protein